MATHMKLVLHLLLLFLFAVQEVRLVCVDVESDKEGIVGHRMKLTCIYCMKREEISAVTKVEWSYNSPDGAKVPIYLYDNKPQEPEDVGLQWKGRLVWNGSKDLQDLSIIIQNATLNDTGRYECKVYRFFKFDAFELSAFKAVKIDLVVKQKASEDTAAKYSEIMMYVLLVFLTFWLLVEMVYCYRKISKSDEQAQDPAY